MENTRLTIELDADLKAEVKSKCYAEGKTLKEKVIELLLKWLQSKKD